MKNKTLDYYDKNADSFIEGTIAVNFNSTQDRFINILSGKKVLDFGCGSGRDTKYFLEKGLDITAIDGSKEICARASEYTGIDVKQMLFQELDEIDTYDGIWACSSILHLQKKELTAVFRKMILALRLNGVIYTSFKNGDFEGYRNGRFFTDFTLEEFEKLITDIEDIRIEDHWITEDVRPERKEEKWLNLLLRKTSS